MAARTVRRDEEGKKKEERVAVALPSTRRPDTIRYIERKLEDKGLHRLERHPADGLGGIGAPPPKSGHGGKFTWEGPDDLIRSEVDPLPPAIDPNDPNYEEEEAEEAAAEVGEVAKEVVVGEVEVAKAAEARQGVARVDVVPPPTATDQPAQPAAP